MSIRRLSCEIRKFVCRCRALTAEVGRQIPQTETDVRIMYVNSGSPVSGARMFWRDILGDQLHLCGIRRVSRPLCAYSWWPWC